MAIPWLVRALEIKQDAMEEGRRPTDVKDVDDLIDKAVGHGLTERELLDAGREVARRRGR